MLADILHSASERLSRVSDTASLDAQVLIARVLSKPRAWVLAHPFGFGPTGVFIAVSVAFSTMALVSGWLFSKGYWKTRRV